MLSNKIGKPVEEKKSLTKKELPQKTFTKKNLLEKPFKKTLTKNDTKKDSPKINVNRMKIFNRWESNVNVADLGLKSYMNVSPILVPKTSGRNVKIRFHKSKNPIVERLINKLMVAGHRGKKHKISSGHNTGKSLRAYKNVMEAFEIVEKELKINPVEAFVKAVENSAPREEITSIEYGGARYPQAVDCSPQRRVDIVLRMMVQGCYVACFNKKKTVKRALADEIINAYKNDAASSAIAKKNELERQADSAR